jgi:LPXTG-motif cell wall-anchored protein
VSGPDASGKITWSLGEMAAGTTRQVTFKVTIDDVAGSPGEVVAVDILNGGAVRSDRVPTVLSNVVRTPVSKVLPVKIPRELPHTGATLPLGPTVGGAVLLLGLGLLLVVAGRRRDLLVHRR